MTPAPRDKRWLDENLPHRGRMNLLGSVAHWDAAGIRCLADSHRAADNPLRRGGELPAACGIEYAAQAVAAHGALMAGDGRPMAPGFLASVRSVTFGARRLDDVASHVAQESQIRFGEAVARPDRVRCQRQGQHHEQSNGCSMQSRQGRRHFFFA